jgi:hypothetical protein
MERAFNLLHTEAKRRWAVVLPERLGIFPAAVLVVALATMNFLIGLGQPPHPMWDEAYYLAAAQRYEDGTAQFAAHPQPMEWPLHIRTINYRWAHSPCPHTRNRCPSEDESIRRGEIATSS